jgi:PEP-CTERM motif-containing protein
MRPNHRTLAVAVSLVTLGIGAAYAQNTTTAGNPAQRGPHDSFFYGPLSGAPRGEALGDPLNTNKIGRPKANHSAVTPVPEPDQWAMMLAGLALVGFIVKRRNGVR